MPGGWSDSDRRRLEHIRDSAGNRDVEGRSGMNRNELVQALRKG